MKTMKDKTSEEIEAGFIEARRIHRSLRGKDRINCPDGCYQDRGIRRGMIAGIIASAAYFTYNLLNLPPELTPEQNADFAGRMLGGTLLTYLSAQILVATGYALYDRRTPELREALKRRGQAD